MSCGDYTPPREVSGRGGAKINRGSGLGLCRLGKIADMVRTRKAKFCLNRRGGENVENILEIGIA